MDIYKVELAKAAECDMKDIARYITSKLNAPTAAINTVQAIRAEIGNLKTNALLHSLVRNDRLSDKGYRPMIIKNYIVFYVVNEKDKIASVARILHSRRDWQSIL
ncbi:MAG: type II toxin-antitoxin system RelE/ParE family toxin [Oscillospiraceae bacterium]|nr:type II toxin-antitoxin system RelE/ParE family toxin [Oscillospiraceae bacterium]